MYEYRTKGENHKIVPVKNKIKFYQYRLLILRFGKNLICRSPKLQKSYEV